MKENVKYYVCVECGNVFELIEEKCDGISCCGKPVKKLEANTTDASPEKHVPVYKVVEDEIIVSVGSVEHPMEKDHYIMWISQVTDNNNTRIKLFPEQGTQTIFKYIKGSTIYAYCNKHGLWMCKVN